MATIFCFTSTGNSLYTAKRIAEQIHADVKPMNRGISGCDDAVIGFVFPVYFWGLPRMVERFIRELAFDNKNAYLFAVATAGGTASGMLGRVQELLQPKGLRLQYGMRIVSVSNYLPEYLPKNSEELRERIHKSIMEISDAVKGRQTNSIKAYGLFNRFAYRFYPDERSDRHFSIAPGCTGCGTCMKICPAKNITMASGKPVFHHRCEHCLGCLHNCPVRVINWKQKTQGKARYRNSGVSLNELIAFNSDTDR